MNQDNGGIIGKINTPTTSLASGVWSLDSQFDSQASSIWPLAFPQTTIANACRLDDGSSDGFSLSGQNGNRKTFTFSCWVKRGVFGENFLFNSRIDASNHFLTRFTGDHKLELLNRTSASNNFILTTNRLFRDVSAWYHIVVAVDTTQSTANDRVKFYVNGVQETSFATQTIGSQSADLSLNTSSATHYIGQEYTSGENFFDGYLAETIFVDGQALNPTSFGATNPVTNIWEPIAYAGTYGTNGFRLDFADSSALGNDVSGNDNDFTANNLTSIDQASDTCSNNFATWNPLARFNGNFNFSNGNTSVSAPIGTWNGSIATMGFNSGKWYWEAKFSGNADNQYIGVFDESANTATNNPMNRTGTTAFYNYDGGEMIKDGSVTTADYGTITSSQTCGVAVDADNNYISIYRDGSAIVSNYALSTTKNLLFPFISVYYTTADYNFGNPPYSISSGNADANGHGNFEYAPPSGYFALCTKNLAEFGG